MLSANFVWFLSSLSVSFFVNNVEARLEGEGIIGGEKADEGQFPYQVAIDIIGHANVCGGAIISEEHILTAAHCVIDKYGFFETILSVKVGLTDGNRCAEKHLVKRIYVPWQYTPKGVNGKNLNVTSDIAVLKLSKKLDLSPGSRLQALKLPQGQVTNNKTSYSRYGGQKAILSGYGVNVMNVKLDENGKKEEDGTSDNQLRFAETTIIPNEKCKNMYKNKNKINPAILCAQITQGDNMSRGACSADSGSPLVFNGTVVGVLVASPMLCDETKQPAIYSRVTYYMKFIKNAMTEENLKDMRVAELTFEYTMIDESKNSPSKTWEPEL